MVLLYIDPGAGSMVIQALLAGILAIPFFFRTQIGRFVASIKGRRGDKTEDAARD